LTETKIIKYCKKGDERGFKSLVDRYAPKLMGICLRYMKDEFAAKDVLQESFIKIFEGISRYENTGSFEAWLCKITVRCALMTLRKQKKFLLHAELNNTHEEIYQDAEVEVDLDEADILEMIKQLPDHYRIIFNMYVIEGYNHAEISELLNIPESTSRTKLTRARRKMQEIYIKTMDNAQTTRKRPGDRKILNIF